MANVSIVVARGAFAPYKKFMRRKNSKQAKSTLHLAKDRVLVQMRFKKDLHNQVRAKAAQEDLPVSAWIRRACIAAIEREAKAATA